MHSVLAGKVRSTMPIRPPPTRRAEDLGAMFAIGASVLWRFGFVITRWQKLWLVSTGLVTVCGPWIRFSWLLQSISNETEL